MDYGICYGGRMVRLFKSDIEEMRKENEEWFNTEIICEQCRTKFPQGFSYLLENKIICDYCYCLHLYITGKI